MFLLSNPQPPPLFSFPGGVRALGVLLPFSWPARCLAAPRTNARLECLRCLKSTPVGWHADSFVFFESTFPPAPLFSYFALDSMPFSTRILRDAPPHSSHFRFHPMLSQKIASEGICIVSLALDRDQEQPCVSLRMSFEGLENEGDPDGIINPFRLAVHAAINALPKTKRTNTDISKTVRKLLAKFCLQEFGKEPYVTVHILPVSRSSSDERA
eukprot:m.113613 g.113613  ORF g.113613 m.113613 type:complete len:213 (+) comp9424_c0_seq6:1720-2358(+)